VVTRQRSYPVLVPGWVTICGWVHHLGTEPSTQAYSAWARLLWQAGMNIRRKLGE